MYLYTRSTSHYVECYLADMGSGKPYIMSNRYYIESNIHYILFKRYYILCRRTFIPGRFVIMWSASLLIWSQVNLILCPIDNISNKSHYIDLMRPYIMPMYLCIRSYRQYIGLFSAETESFKPYMMSNR